jgi:hypothetical protein
LVLSAISSFHAMGDLSRRCGLCLERSDQHSQVHTHSHLGYGRVPRHGFDDFAGTIQFAVLRGSGDGTPDPENFPSGRCRHAHRLHVHLANSRVHFSKISEHFFVENNLLHVPDPPYSPNITSSDFDRVSHPPMSISVQPRIGISSSTLVGSRGWIKRDG